MQGTRGSCPRPPLEGREGEGKRWASPASQGGKALTGLHIQDADGAIIAAGIQLPIGGAAAWPGQPPFKCADIIAMGRK